MAGKYDALERYREAIALHDRPFSPDPQGAIQAMNAIAVTLTYMGRFDDARVEYEAALARARRTSPTVVPFLIANLGGASCPTGLATDRSFTEQVVQDWLNEFERIQWLLRTSGRLRQLHGD